MKFSHSNYQEPLKTIAILNYQFTHVIRKCKFLGVKFNNNIKIQNVFSQVSKSCGIMYQAKNSKKDLHGIDKTIRNVLCTTIMFFKKLCRYTKTFYITEKMYFNFE